MPDDPTKTGGADRSRVNVNEDHELQYWTRRFGVSAEELREIVDKVGPMVSDVEEELDAQK